MRFRRRFPSRPIALSVHVVLACAIAGGLRAESAAHAEPSHAEPAHAEPAHAESAQAEPAHAEPAKAEPVKTESAHGEETHGKTTATKEPAKADSHAKAAAKSHGTPASSHEPEEKVSEEKNKTGSLDHYVPKKVDDRPAARLIRELDPSTRSSPMDPTIAPEDMHEGVTPEEAASLNKLGAKLTDRGDYVSAEIAFRQVLSASDAPLEETKTALLGLARMHRKEGTNLTKAAAIYEKYLKEYPGDNRSPECLLELGRTLRSMGAYKLAIARFYNVINSTLKVSGEGFDRYQLLARTAQFEIAETHLESGNYVEAGKFFTRLRLLELAPVDRARAQFKAAYAQHMNGDLEAAVQSFRAYLEQWPKDDNTAEARYYLAIDLRGTKRAQEAMKVTLELLQTEKEKMGGDPKRFLYWQRRTGNQLANEFFETGNIANAQAIYSGLAALSTEPVWKLPLTYQIGLCRERLGDSEGARKAYQTVIDSAGATPSEDLAEVVRMASWRMGQLGWRDDTVRQITSYFETSTGRASESAPTAAVPAHAGSTTTAQAEPASVGKTTP